MNLQNSAQTGNDGSSINVDIRGASKCCFSHSNCRPRGKTLFHSDAFYMQIRMAICCYLFSQSTRDSDFYEWMVFVLCKIRKTENKNLHKIVVVVVHTMQDRTNTQFDSPMTCTDFVRHIMTKHGPPSHNREHEHIYIYLQIIITFFFFCRCEWILISHQKLTCLFFEWLVCLLSLQKTTANRTVFD